MKNNLQKHTTSTAKNYINELKIAFFLKLRMKNDAFINNHYRQQTLSIFNPEHITFRCTPTPKQHLLKFTTMQIYDFRSQFNNNKTSHNFVRKEGNVLFNDALNTFYLRLYGVGHMVKDHSDSEKGNPLPPHRLLLSINSKGSFICTIPQRG